MSSELAISAAMVKQLRGATGSPMMDCKRALQNAGGDQEKALEWLRKKGMATAAKKESRKSADGLVCAVGGYPETSSFPIENDCVHAPQFGPQRRNGLAHRGEIRHSRAHTLQANTHAKAWRLLCDCK